MRPEFIDAPSLQFARNRVEGPLEKHFHPSSPKFEPMHNTVPGASSDSSITDHVARHGLPSCPNDRLLRTECAASVPCALIWLEPSGHFCNLRDSFRASLFVGKSLIRLGKKCFCEI